VECRASTATCDPAELCTGSTATCPTDTVNSSAPVGATVRVAYDSGTSTATISWPTEVELGPFNVYRGSSRPGLTWSYNQSCLNTGITGTSTTDSLTPTPLTTFYYLVSRKTPACTESSLGQASSTAERPNSSPCSGSPGDADGDGVINALDNCPSTHNPDQNAGGC
jgi:hypothetical protein